ncbi:MAG: hypothetical protein JNG89_02180 [Planctomycetaceae bacterium]|nr:hypothetical protein [Planctomycetaceae bacterium]
MTVMPPVISDPSSTAAVHEAVDLLAKRAGKVRDARLQHLLFRAGSAILEAALRNPGCAPSPVCGVRRT